MNVTTTMALTTTMTTTTNDNHHHHLQVSVTGLNWLLLLPWEPRG
jgi:hypothetical protein